jgi:hypothetical protein
MIENPWTYHEPQPHGCSNENARVYGNCLKMVFHAPQDHTFDDLLAALEAAERKDNPGE